MQYPGFSAATNYPRNFETPPRPANGPGAHSPKKRFHVLNTLERRGLQVQQQELETRWHQTQDPKVRVDLLKANLREIESCYQAAKDELEQANKNNQQKQNALVAKDLEIAGLKSDLQTEKVRKRKVEDNYDQLAKQHKEKQGKLDEAAAESKKLATTLRALDQSHQEEINAVKQAIQQMHQAKNEQLQQQLAALQANVDDMKRALADKEIQVLELSLAVDHHTSTMNDIEALIHKGRQSILGAFKY